MKRRDFLKTTTALGSAALLSPNLLLGESELVNVKFDLDSFNTNNSQSIVIFLYGGASELAGNMTNMEEIKELSQNEYPDIEVTPNGFWSEAGGDLMEEMLEDNTMSIVRTIYRELDDSRSHGNQQLQNLKGDPGDDSTGIFRNIQEILFKNSQISSNSVLSAASIGESAIFDNGDLNNNTLLRAVTINNELDNPYELSFHKKLNDEQHQMMQELLEKKNALKEGENSFLSRFKEHYFKRADLSTLIEEIKQSTLPEEFPNTDIGESLESMIKLMNSNSSTKLGFISYPGGWDDHSNAIYQYQNRHNQLIEALYAATRTLKSLNNQSINIWVMTEFGRNVNLNNSEGWDHGNQFNLMLFSNNPALKMGQVLGSTKVNKESDGRIYTAPADDSISYEPYSIGSSLYKLFGVQNPESISGYPAIDELFS